MLVVLATLVFAAPALAQTSAKLVGNTGQTASSSTLAFNNDMAQAFDTGSSTGGYKLTSVKANIDGNTGVPTYTARIFLADNNTGHPTGSSLGTLTNPSSLTADGIVEWTATGDGIDLDASEGYVFFLDVTATASSAPSMTATTSDGEDTGGASGWSIADARFQRASNLNTWNNNAAALHIEIHGYAKASHPTITISGGSAVAEGTAAEFTVTASPAPSANVTVNLAVSELAGSDYVASTDEGTQTVTINANSATATYSVPTQGDSTDEPNGRVTVQVAAGTGYAVGSTSSANVTVNDDDDPIMTPGDTPAAADVLVSNTMESSSGNTNLSFFDLAQGFTTGPNPSGYTLTSAGVSFTGSSSPDAATVKIATGTPSAPTVVATLTSPSPLTPRAINTFTAPAGTTLDADTTYYMLIEGTSALVDNAHSTDESGAAGWSIANTNWSKSKPNGSWITHTGVLQISISGTANANDTTAPVLSTATVDGTMLTLTYDEALDPNSVPAAADFTVTVDGSEVTLSDSSPVTVSGSTVTLTLAAAVTDGQAVTVSYTKGTNPIQDATGNDAAELANQAVTVTTSAPGDPTAPALSTATVDGTTLMLTFDAALDPAAAPEARRFSVTGTRTATNVTAVAFKSGDATTVRLTLDPAVAFGETGIAVSYAAGDDANPLQDPSGRKVGDFSGQAATNETPASSVGKRKAALERTLAALGRQLLTSALDGVNARFAERNSGPAATGQTLESVSAAELDGPGTACGRTPPPARPGNQPGRRAERLLLQLDGRGRRSEPARPALGGMGSRRRGLVRGPPRIRFALQGRHAQRVAGGGRALRPVDRRAGGLALVERRRLPLRRRRRPRRGGPAGDHADRAVPLRALALRREPGDPRGARRRGRHRLSLP